MVLVPLLFVLWRLQELGVGFVHELKGFWTGETLVLVLDGTFPLVPPTTPTVAADSEPPLVTVNADDLLELLMSPHPTFTAELSIVMPLPEPLSAMMVLAPLVSPANALTVTGIVL